MQSLRLPTAESTACHAIPNWRRHTEWLILSTSWYRYRWTTANANKIRTKKKTTERREEYPQKKNKESSDFIAGDQERKARNRDG